MSEAAPLPFELKVPGAEFSLAFQALPVVLVMSVLTSLLFYWRILPPIVRGLVLAARAHARGRRRGRARRPRPTIFLGMIEAPLFIRPYLVNLTRAELFIVMTAGMACIAGTVLVIYATMLGAGDPQCAGPSGGGLGPGRARRHPDQP